MPSIITDLYRNFYSPGNLKTIQAQFYKPIPAQTLSQWMDTIYRQHEGAVTILQFTMGHRIAIMNQQVYKNYVDEFRRLQEETVRDNLDRAAPNRGIDTITPMKVDSKKARLHSSAAAQRMYNMRVDF